MKRRPTKMELYARRFGYTVEYTDLSPNIGGYILADGEALSIVVNRTWPAPEHEFTIAHELAHCRVHYGQKELPIKYVREVQANLLAWTLLFWQGAPETFAACLERHPLALPQVMLAVVAALVIMAEERAERFRDNLPWNQPQSRKP